MVKRVLQALFAVGVVLAGLASSARAVDAPKWVAAMYIDAQGQIGLRWQPVPGATAYNVLRSTTKGTGYQQVASPAVPQHFDTGVTPGTTYYYTLQAVTAAGTSASSDERTVVVPKKAAKISPPVWKQAVMDQTAAGIKLEWQSVAGAAAYNIFRRESFKPVGKEDLIASVQTAEVYIDKSELKKGIEYIYSLSVLDSTFTESDKSSQQSVKFAPKEEVKEVKKQESQVQSRKTEFLGEITYHKTEGVTVRGQSSPVSVAIYEGEIFVLFSNRVVQVFSEKRREFDREFTGNGEGGAFPSAINYMTIDPNGALIIVDPIELSIRKYSAKDGAFIGSFSALEGYNENDPLDKYRVMPAFLAFGPDGDTVFLTDMGNNTIRVFDAKGKFKQRIGQFGGKPGEFSGPGFMFLDKTGRLFVTEVVNSRVQILDKDYKGAVMFGEPGTRTGQFGMISGLTVDPDKKRIYVSDYVTNVVHIWSEEGKFEGVIKYKDQANNKTFNNPGQIARGSDGTLYVVDVGMQTVVAFRDLE